MDCFIQYGDRQDGAEREGRFCVVYILEGKTIY